VNTNPSKCNGKLAPADAMGNTLLDDNGKPMLT
jgi:hypothetical protein